LSFRIRYGFSLFANLAKAGITFGTGVLVARGLGPNQYGTMIFLLGTFTAVRQLFDLGSSSAFFTFLSQRQRSRIFVGWYFAWIGLQFLLTFLMVGIFFPTSWVELIWKGEQRSIVLLAFLAAYMQSVLWSVILQMGESQRLTRWTQGVAFIVSLVHFMLMAIAFWTNLLSIPVVFGIIIVEWFIAVTVILKKLRFTIYPEEGDTLKEIANQFWRYCLPLIPYSWLGFGYEFADRWFLQNYGGALHQAFYAVGFQFGSIVAIATSSILNIFWKEISEAHYQNNIKRVTTLYTRVSRGLFFIAAAGAGFLAPWAESILSLTLGAAYTEGSSTLMIMFFYPLHQSIGQICGAMSYATGRVAAYVKIGMVMMASSIVLTYFILADADAPLPGLALGSLGLAGKMVAMQILSVNILAFYLSRSLRIKFDWVFQLVTTFICVVAGLVSYGISQILISNSNPNWNALILAGVIYILFMILLVCTCPSLVGLHRVDLVAFFSKDSRFVNKK
jgi:O-antigen/teichoic acid export membrane protein